jgi:predicted nucleic acid-binding protein
VNAYVDSSVLLRIVLGQQNALREWRKFETGIVSAIAEVECLRTLDRLRLKAGLDDEAIAERREGVYGLLAELHVVDATRPVLARAAQPLPTALRTLDAIHLATAQLWREHSSDDLVMATHDAELGLAARAVGFRVLGL